MLAVLIVPYYCIKKKKKKAEKLLVFLVVRVLYCNMRQHFMFTRLPMDVDMCIACVCFYLITTTLKELYLTDPTVLKLELMYEFFLRLGLSYCLKEFIASKIEFHMLLKEMSKR